MSEQMSETAEVRSETKDMRRVSPIGEVMFKEQRFQVPESLAGQAIYIVSGPSGKLKGLDKTREKTFDLKPVGAVRSETRAEGREEQLFRCRKHRAEIMVNGTVYRLPSIYMGRQVRVRTEADGSLYDVRRMDGMPVSAVTSLSEGN